LLSAKKIQAGKGGQIEVRIKTENLSGAVEKRVNIMTNDPHHSTVTISVKAVVEPEIDMSESTIYFGNAPMGQEIQREVILTLPAGGSIRILNAASSDRSVAVKLEPVPGSDGRKMRLTAIQKANANPGYHFGRIILKTTSPRTRVISIYERGVVAAAGN
jgi:hypothetical protein